MRLGGMTLPIQYQEALQDWRDESRSRRRAIRDSPGNDSLPAPRGWYSYAEDPNADGNDSDALFLEDWWDEASPGRNENMVQLYKMVQADAIASAEGFREKSEEVLRYGMELLAPKAVIKTSMADYVPNPLNIFTNKDGSRFDPSTIDGFWKRAGANLTTGAIGFTGIAVIGIGAFILSPRVMERSLELVEQGISGSLEIISTTITGVKDVAKAPFRKTANELEI